MAVLLEEVVFDLPRVLDAEPIGELDLLECIVDQASIGVVLPRPPDLVLVEDAELHGQQYGGVAATVPRR